MMLDFLDDEDEESALQLINPLRGVRQSLTPVVTQSAVAKRANVSRMVVLRAEQGMYLNPPEKIVSALAKFAGFAIGYSELSALYAEWQQAHRQYAQEWINNGWFLTDDPSGHSPFYQWRVRVAPVDSAMGFCRLLCVHPNALRLYETRSLTAAGSMQMSMPEQIEIALSQAGMDLEGIILLQALQNDWKLSGGREDASAYAGG